MGMTREEYEGKRGILHDRMVAADDEIHKQERNCDEDVKYGDVRSFRYHDICMKSAEEDFNRSADEIHKLDRDYWGESGKSSSAESEMEKESVSSVEQDKDNQSAQSAQTDYWEDAKANESSANELENGNEKANEAGY